MPRTHPVAGLNLPDSDFAIGTRASQCLACNCASPNHTAARKRSAPNSKVPTVLIALPAWASPFGDGSTRAAAATLPEPTGGLRAFA